MCLWSQHTGLREGEQFLPQRAPQRLESLGPSKSSPIEQPEIPRMHSIIPSESRSEISEFLASSSSGERFARSISEDMYGPSGKLVVLSLLHACATKVTPTGYHPLPGGPSFGVSHQITLSHHYYWSKYHSASVTLGDIPTKFQCCLNMLFYQKNYSNRFE